MRDWAKRALFSSGRRLRCAAGVVLPPVLLAACLFGDTALVQTAPLLGSVFQEIAAACRDRETQWMVVASLAMYLVALLAVEWRLEGGRFWRWRNPQLWLGALAVIALARYALSYDAAATSRQVPGLLGGMVLGLGARVWTRWPNEVAKRSRRTRWLLASLTLLLAAGALWQASAGATFQYRGAERWRGPWGNPNLYGLLMGVGLVLALGMAGQRAVRNGGWKAEDGGWTGRRRWLALAGWSVAAVVFAVGLVRSYSRGAWLGTALALAWLGYQVVRSQVGKLSGAPSAGVAESAGSFFVRSWRGLVRERVAVLTVVVALAVLAFWGLSHSDWRPARRVASVSNAKDFSWRNRVAAWEGALAMMADRPWTGYGWNQPEPMYDQYYRAPAIAEGMAIQLNHYFLLGMSAGLPALVCLLAYVGLRLRTRVSVLDCGSPLAAPCRAAAIVLLVGFWFDGGLFSLPTATVFWMLLELGADRPGSEPEPGASGFASWRGMVFVALLSAGALGWARARDPFVRLWFTIWPARTAATQAVALLPKSVKARPVVVYLHGSDGTLLTDGNDLRQMAEMGLAVVAIDYCQTNDAEFTRQFTALLDNLQQQPWADPGAVAWLGYSLGAEKATRFALGHPEFKPRWLVRLAGGWLPELAGASRTATLPPVWLVHGAQDEVFPVAEARRVATALETNGVPVVLTVLPGLGHGFQPQRGGIYRALGESALAELRGRLAFKDYRSVTEWRATATPLWVWWLPAAVWLGGWWIWRRRRRGFGEEGGSQEKAARLEALSDYCAGATRWVWGLRGIGVLVAVAALIVVGGQLLVPRLPVNDRTVAMARRWLVPSGARADFDWLAAQPLWQGRKLASLLSEVELARYNRGLVNWQVDEALYREAVLSPSITRAAGEDFGWRGKLWESLYPRVRRESSLDSAVAIVMAHVRERVTTAAAAGGTGSVSAAWQAQLTDAAGFEALCVAGLRAVGIPARLDGAGEAVYWEGTAWRQVPRAWPRLSR